jgi:cytidylate kinase
VKRVIAIDGPSGAGKSTIARLLAKDLGFDYLDTGALYRAVALALMKLGLKEDSSDELISSVLLLTQVRFKDGKVILNGTDVSEEIRTREASHFASVFSAKMPVRSYLLDIQRNAALTSDLVAEGRDMTTVVFPDAFAKFFLDASVEERAKRRTLELRSKGFEADESMIKMEIAERDARDARRDIAPLRKADDACFIDSTGLSIEDVFNKITVIIKNRAEKNGLKP